MNLNEYQQEALQFQLKSAKSISYLITGICAEAGELAGHYAKHVRDNVDKTDLILKEVGDVLWFCAAIADYYDVNLDDIAQGNLSKLKSRMERGVIQGSGDER
jgi:NTP pyrophosphatase (non-canonical NTP hydrolase)